MRIARKLTLAFILGVVAVHATSLALRVERLSEYFHRETARDARVLGRALGHAVERTVRTRSVAEGREIIDYATEQESQIHIRWVALNAAPGTPDAPMAPADSLAYLRLGRAVDIHLEEPQRSLYVYVPVVGPDGGPGAIEIADPVEEEEDYLRQSVINTALWTATLVVIMAALAWFLGLTLIGRPVQRLVAQAEAIGQGDLSRRLAMGGTGEFVDLAREMDRMAERLLAGRQRLEEETQSRIAALEQLRHADRLSIVGRLASGVAHELGTPINVIEGHAQLIKEGAPGADPTDHASIISKQCQRMTQIIRQLLDFARRGPSGSASCDAGEAALATVQMLSPLLRKQQVEAQLERGEVDASVAIAQAQLQQVLTNLAVNALQAMPEGGTLKVSIDEREVTQPPAGRQPGVYVVVHVEDTGVGMDDATRERAFEPFFTTKEVGEGTGLGLSVAYGLVEEVGGWIALESEPGHGSRFSIFLPRRRSAV